MCVDMNVTKLTLTSVLWRPFLNVTMARRVSYSYGTY